MRGSIARRIGQSDQSVNNVRGDVPRDCYARHHCSKLLRIGIKIDSNRFTLRSSTSQLADVDDSRRFVVRKYEEQSVTKQLIAN